jgi:hypothetical protein
MENAISRKELTIPESNRDFPPACLFSRKENAISLPGTDFLALLPGNQARMRDIFTENWPRMAGYYLFSAQLTGYQTK